MEPKTTLDAPAGLLEDLDALEADGLPRPERLPWQPASLVDVDWILETMGELDAEAAQNQALADAATQRILERLDKANGALKRRRDYLEGLARHYAEEHRPEIIRGKAKSKTLPNGALAWRKTGGRLVRDAGPEAEAALLAWCKAMRDDLVRTKEEPAWTAVQQFCMATPGAVQIVPPGTHWEEADEFGSLMVTPAETALVKAAK